MEGILLKIWIFSLLFLLLQQFILETKRPPAVEILSQNNPLFLSLEHVEATETLQIDGTHTREDGIESI